MKRLSIPFALTLIALTAGCDSKGVCVSEGSQGPICEARAKSDCENDNGSFHDYVEPPSDDGVAAMSYALQQSCASVGFGTAWIPGVYKPD